MRKIGLFWKLSREGKLIFFETCFYSLYAAYLLRNSAQYEKVASILRSMPSQTKDRTIAQEERKIVKLVSSAVQTVAKYTPWRNQCYHQAIQAKLILNRRGIPLKTFIGFRKNSAGKIEGHAWTTTVEEKQVTGFCNPAEYTVLSEFQ